MSNYFRKLPNLDYPSLLKTKQSNTDYVETKNLFRRVKIREDLFSNFVVFDQYKVIGDERPDNVAEKVYGDDNLDWVILMSNNIIDIKNEWPMTQNDLNTYINEKYTQKELSHIHHYETVEFRDRNNQLLVPAGKVVDESFTIEYYLGESGLRNNGQLKTTSPIRSVNNYENEVINGYCLKKLLDKRLITLVDQMVFSGTNFLMTIMLTQLCSPEEFGKYSLIFMLMLFGLKGHF